MAKMKALTKKFPKKGIWLENVDKPTIGDNDVLIKVSKMAICGTDLHIYLWDEWAKNTIPVGMTIGHEYVGTIVEIGSNVHGFSIGDKVTGEGHTVCGSCRHCRTGSKHLCKATSSIGVNINGSFAEYVKLPYDNVWKCIDSIDDSVYSIFDPFGNAVHTTLSYDVFGKNVLVTGAGPIGIMAGMIAKHLRAKNVVITDVNPYRIELAKKVGLHVVDVSSSSITDKAKQLNIDGFDVGLEMSGNPFAFNDMIESMAIGGNISLLAIQKPDVQVDWNKIVFGALNLKGIYGREMFKTWYQMQDLLETGLDLSPVITHTFKFEDFQKGFDLMEKGNCGKIILEWD